MDTTRVDVSYRPLRIAWAIAQGDKAAFRNAVRMSQTMWGGRYNPIVVVGAPDADDLVKLFRADAIVPVGDDEALTAFVKQYPHLNSPLFPNRVFLRDGANGKAHVLDLHNALVHWRDRPGWKKRCEKGLRAFSWQDSDPLADAFLVQFGRFADKAETGIDYYALLQEAAQPHPVTDLAIDETIPLPAAILDQTSISFLCRANVRRHYAVRSGWDSPGVFAGDASKLEDLVRFWNLRAADIEMHFIDMPHLDRYDAVRPLIEQHYRNRPRAPRDRRMPIAVWGERGIVDQYAGALFAKGDPIEVCALDEQSWRGGAVKAPIMFIDRATALGVLGERSGQPRVSFALSNKPFNGDAWFHTQHLVASLAFIGGPYGAERHMFQAPWIPELNEIMAREMGVSFNKLRAEPEGLGLVIDAADHDVAISALPVERLAAEVFKLAGFEAKPSSAGLITRQLITRLGGADGARSFKIPGVRRLLKTYGPRDAFTRKSAVQLIGARDDANPDARFEDHKRLFIESRDHASDLTPQAVFAHLVEKGLFQIGMTVTCTTCRLPSWVKLDALRQQHDCELCGASFDATRQLVGGEFDYRRSGVLGLEKNTQGAVPVTLLLQQLAVNLNGTLRHCVLLPSLDLKPLAADGSKPCETDFFVLSPRPDGERIQLIIGECKDRGGTIDANDVANLRRVADALPRKRFETFILFVKLAPFSADEIALAKSLNQKYVQRVILLTDKELEPYDIYERHKEKLGHKLYASTPAELAEATRALYFGDD